MVTDSILLYAAPVWSGGRTRRSKEVLQANRLSALRVACAYRTVSDDAICVIASKVPLDIRAEELKRLYHSRGHKPTSEDKITERERTIAKWQNRWDHSSKGRWTYKLIPKLDEWISRKHGETDYYLTQILSGHGGFLAYLHRFNLADNSTCPECHSEDESAEHVTFHCARFYEERFELAKVLGVVPTPENLVTQMLNSKEKWEAVKQFAARILIKLRNLEWERKAEAKRMRPI